MGCTYCRSKADCSARSRINSNGKPVTIQPISIACTEIDGLPITRAWRPYYAWFGDMTLIGHLWNVFKLGRFTVDVVFHPPTSPQPFADRKVLARYCQQQVAHGIEQCLTGRHDYEEKSWPHRIPAPKHRRFKEFL